jgi:hypothetical protein
MPLGSLNPTDSLTQVIALNTGANSSMQPPNSTAPPVSPTDPLARKDVSAAIDYAGDNMVSQIQAITQTAQNFFSTDIMARSLTWQNFSVGSNQWSSRYPYRFMVLQLNGNTYNMVSEFRLPINPQDLTISSSPAIRTTVTTGGILEEHNGIPLKQITINGTTGIFLARTVADAANSTPSTLGSIFAGTIGAANSLVNSVNTLLGQSGTPSSTELLSTQLQQTGYYQYHMLRLFLETYAFAKKSPNNQNLRLAFDIPKDQQTYLVTPQQFVTRRSVDSPLEYRYSINLLTWGTVPSQYALSTAGLPNALTNNLSSFQQFLNTLTQARVVLANAQNVIMQAKADVQTNIFGPLNSVILILKGILSVGTNLADLPSSLQQSFTGSVVNNWNTLVTQNPALQQFNAAMQQIITNATGVNSYVANPATTNAVNPYKSSVFSSIAFTDNIPITALQPNQTQQNAVTQAITNANDITANDINNFISNIQALNTALEPSISTRSPIDPEWDILYSLQQTTQVLYAMIANGQFQQSVNSAQLGSTNATQATNALSYWQQTNQTAGIPFTSPQGRFLVPFPKNGTLEGLAEIYLGDATLWYEIAALNGLQYPYIDETGFTYSFIANGDGNQFSISSNVNLYVGQIINISSATQINSQRTILAINEVTTTDYLITVDGNPNLSDFTMADDAEIMAYLPYTVNSMREIYIPTNQTTQNPPVNTPILTYIPDDLNLVQFSKIDLLLDQQYDLAISPNGFANLAFGKTNLVQAAKLKMATVVNSLLLHPNYGAGIAVGTSTSEIDPATIINQINQSFQNDPRFNAPSSVNMTMDGGSIQMQITAQVAQQNGILPISMELTD